MSANTCKIGLLDAFGRNNPFTDPAVLASPNAVTLKGNYFKTRFTFYPENSCCKGGFAVLLGPTGSPETCTHRKKSILKAKRKQTVWIIWSYLLCILSGCCDVRSSVFYFVRLYMVRNDISVMPKRNYNTVSVKLAVCKYPNDLCS